MKFQQAQPTAVRPALAAGLASSVCAASVGGGSGPISLEEALITGAVYSLALFAAIVIGGRRAVLLLWGLMLALWAALLFDTVAAGYWRFAEAARMISAPFMLWSLLAAPLALGTAVFEHVPRPHGIALGVSVAVIGGWLSLLALFGYAVRFPPDVGSYPRYGSTILGASAAASALLPCVVSVACIHKMRSSRARWVK